jgi:hypothetical protein
MIEFNGEGARDDAAYFRWLKETPNGFVLNLRRGSSSDYIVLHRASCRTISNRSQEAGAYTEREYRKICAETVDTLRIAARCEGRADGSFSNECSACSPGGTE